MSATEYNLYLRIQPTSAFNIDNLTEYIEELSFQKRERDLKQLRLPHFQKLRCYFSTIVIIIITQEAEQALRWYEAKLRRKQEPARCLS